VVRRRAAALVVATVGLLAACSVPGGTGDGSSARPPLHAFDTYRTLDGGSVVQVSFTGFPDESGPCRAEYRAEASETSQRVYVQVQTLRVPGEQALPLCQRTLGPRTASVSLRSPMGGRAVVDAATGQLIQAPTG
jgi:hypothetical protein